MAIQSEVLSAVVSASTGGDNTLVLAVTGKKIRVIALVLVASVGANSVRLESGASGTALTGVMDIVDNGQLILPWNPAGWCETAASALLNLELSASTAVGGVLNYVTLE